MLRMALRILVDVLLLVFLSVFCLCKGEDSSVSLSPMEKKEQETLYSVIQGFVGKEWNGSDLYPDPCGWTPIQVRNYKLLKTVLFFQFSLNFNGTVQAV